MKINEASIPHYRCEKIPIKNLKSKISINESYLKEKPTWYEINEKMHYFKIRKDFRVFTEIFFSKFAKEIMDLQTVEYHPAYIREKDPTIDRPDEKKRFGLISENFQNSDCNHYLVSELMNAEISDFICYNGYNLKSLLQFFKDYLCNEDYKKNELFLIKLFISDGFTYQVDRNPNNIAFQIPKLEGISYKERLRIEKLKKANCINSGLAYSEERQDYLLKGFSPNVVFDSERILGVDHQNVKNYNPDDCWKPLFPYSSELNFENMEESKIKKIRDKEFDGLDPNLCSLYFEYPEICQPYFERLVYDDEYRKILEECENSSDPIYVDNNEIEYVTNVLENQRKVFKRILTL